MFQRCLTSSSRVSCRICYHHRREQILSFNLLQFRGENGDERSNIPGQQFQLRHVNSSNKSNSNSNSNSNKRVLPNSLSSLNFKYMETDELREAFRRYDQNSDGWIDAKEAVQLVKDADHSNSSIDRKNCAELKVSAEEIIRSMDRNNDKKICWEEFREAVEHAATPVSSRVYPISGTMLINFTGQGVMVPVLPFLARAAGLSTSELGMVTASSALARIVSNVPAALAAEEFGRRPMLIVGPMLGAMGMLGLALAPSDSHAFFSLCAANTVCGFGSAITMAGCGLYLTDISTPLNRARTMAPLQFAGLVGFMVGPPIGGFIADSYGLQYPFYITSGALMLTAASAMAFLPETKRKLGTSKSQTGSDEVKEGKSEGLMSAARQWREMLKNPDIQGISSVSYVTGLLQGAYAVTTVIYASETLMMSTGEVGMMFTAAVIGMAAVTKPATDFSDWFHNKGHCRSTLIIPGLGLAALATGMRGLEMFPTVLPFTALFMMSHLANACLITPNVTPFLVDATTESQRAQALAMRNMCQDLGVLSGAISLGAVSQAIGVPESIVCSAGLQALAMILFAMKTSSGRQRKRADKMDSENKST